jgi:hypothetical protein
LCKSGRSTPSTTSLPPVSDSIICHLFSSTSFGLVFVLSLQHHTYNACHSFINHLQQSRKQLIISIFTIIPPFDSAPEPCGRRISSSRKHQTRMLPQHHSVRRNNQLPDPTSSGQNESRTVPFQLPFNGGEGLAGSDILKLHRKHSRQWAEKLRKVIGVKGRNDTGKSSP